MTEDQIIAYVDGELGPIEALRFERAMEADAALAAAVGRHRTLRDRIAGHFAPVAEEPIPARLAATLDPSSNVVAFPARPRRWSDAGGRYAAIAATLVAGLVLGQLLPRGPAAPIGERGGAIMAQGGLAAALDRDLAAAPGREATGSASASSAATGAIAGPSAAMPARGWVAMGRRAGRWSASSPGPAARGKAPIARRAAPRPTCSRRPRR